MTRAHSTVAWVQFSRRSRIFLRGRPLSCEVPSRRDLVGGGGVVAEFFRGLRKPKRLSGGGGGVVPEIFPWSPKPDAFFPFPWPPEPGTIQWGGGGSTTNFPLMGPFTFLGFPKGGARPPP